VKNRQLCPRQDQPPSLAESRHNLPAIIIRVIEGRTAFVQGSIIEGRRRKALSALLGRSQRRLM